MKNLNHKFQGEIYGEILNIIENKVSANCGRKLKEKINSHFEDMKDTIYYYCWKIIIRIMGNL